MFVWRDTRGRVKRLAIYLYGSAAAGKQPALESNRVDIYNDHKWN